MLRRFYTIARSLFHLPVGRFTPLHGLRAAQPPSANFSTPPVDCSPVKSTREKCKTKSNVIFVYSYLGRRIATKPISIWTMMRNIESEWQQWVYEIIWLNSVWCIFLSSSNWCGCRTIQCQPAVASAMLHSTSSDCNSIFDGNDCRHLNLMRCYVIFSCSALCVMKIIVRFYELFFFFASKQLTPFPIFI